MENLNRVLLENVLPAHVAEHFLARNWKNEVKRKHSITEWCKRCVRVKAITSHPKTTLHAENRCKSYLF